MIDRMRKEVLRQRNPGAAAREAGRAIVGQVEEGQIAGGEKIPDTRAKIASGFEDLKFSLRRMSSADQLTAEQIKEHLEKLDISGDGGKHGSDHLFTLFRHLETALRTIKQPTETVLTLTAVVRKLESFIANSKKVRDVEKDFKAFLEYIDIVDKYAFSKGDFKQKCLIYDADGNKVVGSNTVTVSVEKVRERLTPAVIQDIREAFAMGVDYEIVYLGKFVEVLPKEYIPAFDGSEGN